MIKPLRERIYEALNRLKILKGDLDHVEACLLRTDPSEHKRLVIGYGDLWDIGFNSEPNEIQKINAARKAANLWIEEQTTKGKKHE